VLQTELAHLAPAHGVMKIAVTLAGRDSDDDRTDDVGPGQAAPLDEFIRFAARGRAFTGVRAAQHA
jgi:hypothetical protein